jgi:virginiamycin B lyase
MRDLFDVRSARPAYAALLLVAAPALGVLAATAAPGGAGSAGAPADTIPSPTAAPLPGSAWLAMLPDGDTKRRFILDCTGCHVWNEEWVRGPDGAARTAAEWSVAVRKMTGMVGQGTGFPIISSWPEPEALGAWLGEHFAETPTEPTIDPALLPAEPPEWTEYDVPAPQDLPHDLMVDPEGRVLVTGMFTHRMYRLDPATGTFATVDIPVPNANPRALDVDDDGRWLVLLGGPGALARYDPAEEAWQTWTFGAYPHSVDVGPDGRVWWNGHFTVDPELVGSVDPATGDIARYEVPRADDSDAPPGESTIPYGLRVDGDGVVWATQLRGGQLVRLDPSTGEIFQWKMPTPHAGPRRPDVAPDGSVWIPEYAAGRLARFDPATETFREWALPVPDALPYVVRVNQADGQVWIGTGHGDFVARFDPAQERFTLYPTPTRGALIRHIDIDEARGDVWAAYGASPGIPSKIARLRP